jgi:hypothetical protein
MWTDRASWKPGTIYDLWQFDPDVALAVTAHETTRRGLQRTDILDSDLDEVYEIKPLRSAAEGPPQLNGYLNALRRTSPLTSPIFGPPRLRHWKGGTWDPSRYPLVVPGTQGKVCIIHAWRDLTTSGLLLYDIICCDPVPEDPDTDQPVLAATAVKSVVHGLESMRPQFEEALTYYLAPRSSAYAVLATPRFFETFVIGPWKTEQDRAFDKLYGTRPGPVLTALVLETFVLAHVLPTGPITDILYVSSGFMEPHEITKLWKYRAIAGAAVAAVACFVLAGPELAVAIPEAAEIFEAGEAVASTEPLTVETLEAAAEGPLINGLGTGEALEIGRSLSPWEVNPPGAGLPSGAGIGLTLIGAVVVGIVPATAQAGTGSLPTVVGADPIFLAPAELLIPRRGKIEVGAEVTYGDGKYFIVALATAGAGN